MTKRYYHVDRRCFAPGEVIPPEGTYQDAFVEAAKRMEATLEAERGNFPGKPRRADSLFVFDELHCAESYWRTHDKSYLYEVEFDEALAGHCGDMHLTDAIGAIFRNIGDPNLAQAAQLAQKYWRGDQTEKSCPEYLVAQAKTIKKLRGLSDMKAWVRSQISTGSPADELSIEELLNTPNKPEDN